MEGNGVIVKQDVHHLHPPPSYVRTTSDMPSYQFLESGRGGQLVMLDGYTYSRRTNSRNFYCSKKDRGCKAAVKIDNDGVLTVKESYHPHPRPKYFLKKNGFFIADGGWVYVRETFAERPLLLFEKKLRLQGKDTVFYEFIKSRRGKDLIMINGFTFSQNTARLWICSKYPKCKAKISRNVDGSVSLMSDEHNHKPDKIVRTRDGRKAKGCKARVYLNTDETEIIYLDNNHGHQPPIYAKSSNGCYVKVNEFNFITIAGNKRLLMVKGYTFAKTNKRHWYCSKKAKGCKARVYFNSDETEVVFCDNTHQHKPPIYTQSSDGFYFKLSG
ncbi:hypothetical protein KGM_208278 [Danaus plexippus plexippus]|uniref:FLYWCH-type domain-containing protein n=1 Tax=Danaus plexippus plexippus TaxID=278856 RepID=A0A212EXS1_DANPL|nr:hypothetical protein KGM_208278 [Danaus plexippus plexippus]